MYKRHIVELTEEERADLHTMIGRGIAPARTLTHARILLKANRGPGGPAWTDEMIAGAVEVHRSQVCRIRRLFATAGLAAALHRKAPDRVYARRLDGEQEAHLIALVCSAPPAGRRRWTLRLLADTLVQREIVETISYETVRQTLKQTA